MRLFLNTFGEEDPTGQLQEFSANYHRYEEKFAQYSMDCRSGRKDRRYTLAQTLKELMAENRAIAESLTIPQTHHVDFIIGRDNFQRLFREEYRRCIAEFVELSEDNADLFYSVSAWRDNVSHAKQRLYCLQHPASTDTTEKDLSWGYLAILIFTNCQNEDLNALFNALTEVGLNPFEKIYELIRLNATCLPATYSAHMRLMLSTDNATACPTPACDTFWGSVRHSFSRFVTGCMPIPISAEDTAQVV